MKLKKSTATPLNCPYGLFFFFVYLFVFNCNKMIFLCLTRMFYVCVLFLFQKPFLNFCAILSSSNLSGISGKREFIHNFISCCLLFLCMLLHFHSPPCLYSPILLKVLFLFIVYLHMFFFLSSAPSSLFLSPIIWKFAKEWVSVSLHFVFFSSKFLL